jgi:hypothetical protein
MRDGFEYQTNCKTKKKSGGGVPSEIPLPVSFGVVVVAADVLIHSNFVRSTIWVKLLVVSSAAKWLPTNYYHSSSSLG